MLCESAEKIFKRKDTISSMLCVPGLIFLKHMSHVYDKLLEDLQKDNNSRAEHE
jgi:hypothetical protein